MTINRCLFFLILILIVVFSCSESQDPEAVAKKYCGSCHLMPAPSELPSGVWRDEILPRMEFYLGRRANDPAHPLRTMSMEEQILVRNSGLFPLDPLLSEEEWQQIVEYYVSESEEQNFNFPVQDPYPVQQVFEEKPIRRSQDNPSVVTMVKILKSDYLAYIGNARSEFYISGPKTGWEKRHVLATQSPAVDIIPENEQAYAILQIGQMNPNDRRLGLLSWFEMGNQINTIRDLKRPVRFIASPARENAFIVAEFGHLTGRLSEYRYDGKNKSIMNKPGAVNLQVADLNNDGVEEVICLFGQADESVVYCEIQDTSYTCHTLLRFSPLHGSSDMAIADMNNDGLPDLIIAHGDNADYSMVPKSYHGVTIYVNQGDFRFTKHYFFALNGCTNVEAGDYDNDGDVDLIISSFFPVFGDAGRMTESIVMLENGISGFIPHSFASSGLGRWLVMDSGDLDGDGDIDILLGSFTVHPSPVPKEIQDKWYEQGFELLYLENRN